MKPSDPARLFQLLACVTGSVALLIGGNTALQSAGLPGLWRVLPDILPVAYVATVFWAAVTVALLVLGARLGRRPPEPPPRGGEVVPLDPERSGPAGVDRAA